MKRTFIFLTTMVLATFANAAEPVVEVLVGSQDANPAEKRAHIAGLAIHSAWTSMRPEI